MRAAKARTTLECAQARHLAERDRLRQLRDDTSAHLAEAQRVRARFAPDQHEAIALTEAAIRKDERTLADVEAQLTRAEARLAQDRRAIEHLNAPPGAPPLAEQAHKAGRTALANAFHCGVDPRRSPLADLSLPARLLAADFCGQRSDQAFEEGYGLSDEPALHARLKRIVARLDAGGTRHVSVRILDGCPPEGGGAFATSTTAYLAECQFDAGQTDDEIAFVVAHERAHVQLEHLSLTYLERAWDRATQPRVPEGDPRHAATFIASAAARLGDFDRAQEAEADLHGAAAMMAAGFAPAGVRQALDRIRSTEARAPAARPGDTAGQDLRRMTASHAPAAQRLAALEDALGKEFWKSGAKGCATAP